MNEMTLNARPSTMKLLSGRLDQVLVKLALVKSRAKAQALIKAGKVKVRTSVLKVRTSALNDPTSYASAWQVVDKPSGMVQVDLGFPVDQQLLVEPSAEESFVSRAGYKLDQALKRLDVNLSEVLNGAIALDVGQSTGGFTEVLLQLGCEQILGLEVGRDQLAPHLKEDPRVKVLEGINARYLDDVVLPPWALEGFDWVVMDVSFISQRLIWPGLVSWLKLGSYVLSLVKPQFELGPKAVNKQGVVKNTAAYATLEAEFRAFFNSLGFDVLQYFDSAIKGQEGNQEFFIWAKKC